MSPTSQDTSPPLLRFLLYFTGTYPTRTTNGSTTSQTPFSLHADDLPLPSHCFPLPTLPIHLPPYHLPAATDRRWLPKWRHPPPIFFFFCTTHQHPPEFLLLLPMQSFPQTTSGLLGCHSIAVTLFVQQLHATPPFSPLCSVLDGGARRRVFLFGYIRFEHGA